MTRHSALRIRSLTSLTVAAAATTLMFAACGGGDSNTAGGQVNFGGSAGTDNDASASGGTAAVGNGGNGAGFNIDASSNDGALNEDSACESQSAEATLVKKPVDIIIVIDNSGSMGGEIEAVQNNINVNFANIIGNSGIDYRVIMLARHGSFSSGQSICVEAPLSGIPAGGCSPPPAQPSNTATFFHYSEEISSHNSLCKILDTFRKADEFNLAPSGWEQWLRADSFKMFVEISDDGVNCTSAVTGDNFNDGDSVAGGTTVGTAFDTALRTLSPEMFGAPDGEKNYRFYSIVGLAQNSPATDPWQPTSPIQDTRCSPGSAGQGTGYQQLSILTEALRYPSCENASFDSIFLAIADGVIAGSKVACEFDIPEPPEGETIDLETVVVSYTPGSGGAEQRYSQVPNAASCAADSFYIENDRIFLCPDTCTVVQADDAAKVGILFGCNSGIPH
ncbi:MAG: hypothetical protein H6718_13215 [Polyangiaceae bacterium]|nr:hypothetical protein [Polyangiaceae bacterium]MCB9607032.1 hypothetical protein [Polyangiaceae bacterium]